MRARMWAARAAGAAVLVCAVSIGVSAQSPTPPAMPGHPAPAPAPLIVPGRSIGKWTLDTTLQDLIGQNQAQAQLNLTEPIPQFQKALWYHEWHSPNPPLIALTPAASVRVIALGTFDKTFKTPEGLGVGSTPIQITAAYSDPQITLRPGVGPELLIYNDLGIAFELPYDAMVKGYSVVERVFVFRVGQASTVWVVP